MANSQNGWPASSTRSAIGVVPTTISTGVSFPGGIKSGDVGKILTYVAEQFNARVETLRAGWCWGYAYRSVTSGASLSNHASGTALDLNAPLHPLGKVGTFSLLQVIQIRMILQEVSGVVRWGGDYAGRKDEMHFEILGTARAVAEAAAKLPGSPIPPAPGPTPVPPTPVPPANPVIQQGSKGEAVSKLQRFLQINADGDFGPDTDKATKAYQHSIGLKPDGIVGASTWGKINSNVKVVASQMQQVKRGNMNNNAVRTAQYRMGITPDGDFGPGTEKAVKAWQKARGLGADGIIGPKTWNSMLP